ncbi:MAG: CRISPR-associated endonuclease Cas2 [Reyranella sp.]|uniref:CRISPR-associated endonuclease Cas2 n=1 Tax=Reyranella sp. TaxID=1929291 RepID=UPI0011FDE735|nr:CRISPR-associated endonuclease Cas2 [Reyranella sp.]TAJ42788.1 MAG: CRISPR-associated endonuclease Cas2 [Reyranella sp.]
MIPHWYIFTYDVSNRRRWRAVFKRLGRVGTPIQKSVFLCRLMPAHCRVLSAELTRRLDPTTDRLAVADLGPAVGGTNALDVAMGPQVDSGPRVVIV